MSASADLRRAALLLPAGTSLTLPREALLAALNELTGPDPPAPPAVAEEDPTKWLTAKECAAMLNVKPRWCYDHLAQLGGRRISYKVTRFDPRVVAKYMTRRTS